MKNLILIAVIFGAISCTKTTTTTTAVNPSALVGTYTGKTTSYEDEALTKVAAAERDITFDIKLINSKYGIILKTASTDTIYFTDVKAFSNEHIAFNLVPKANTGEPSIDNFKNYTTSGVSYTGRYLKGTKENLLFYFKVTAGGVFYSKIDGNK